MLQKLLLLIVNFLNDHFGKGINKQTNKQANWTGHCLGQRLQALFKKKKHFGWLLNHRLVILGTRGNLPTSSVEQVPIKSFCRDARYKVQFLSVYFESVEYCHVNPENRHWSRIVIRPVDHNDLIFIQQNHAIFIILLFSHMLPLNLHKCYTFMYSVSSNLILGGPLCYSHLIVH